jgi:hypothetical protein
LLAANRLLLWTPEAKPRPQKPETVVFQFHDLDALMPLRDVRAACEQISGGLVSTVSVAPPLDQFGLSIKLGAGSHAIALPEWITAIGELLVLIDGPDGAWDRGDRRIWSIRPDRGELIVLPQDWFNNGSHDFGYEWITRVARDDSGRIIGDGVRIGPFRLDETGRQLDTWLSSTPLVQTW